jgi:competence protein ComEC
MTLGLGIAAAARWEWVGARFGWIAALTAAAGLALLWPRWGWSGRVVALAAFFAGLGMCRVGEHFFAPVPEPLARWIQEKTPQNILLQAQEYCRRRGPRGDFKGRLLGWYEGDRFHSQVLPLKFAVGDGECPAEPGRYFRTQATFRAPGGFQNPGSFDFPWYLRAQGLWATAYIKGGEWLVPWGEADGIGQSWAAEIRRRLSAGLHRAVDDGPTRGVLEALLLGQEGALAPATEDVFRRTGLTHVLVVSGLHLSLVFSFFFFPLYFLLSLKGRLADDGRARWWALGAAVLPTYAYSLVVGWSPPVLRSFYYALLSALALLSRFRKDFFSLLLLTVLLLLLWNPLLLFDLSFQLSFLSVAAVYFFGRSFKQAIPVWQEHLPCLRFSILQWFLLLLGVTVAVNLALYPLLAYQFHEVSWIAPLTNLCFVPLAVFIILPASLAASLIHLVSSALGEVLFSAVAPLTQGALWLLTRFVEFWGGSRLVAPLSGWDWAVYFSLLLAGLNLHRPRRFLLGLALAAAAWAWVFLFPAHGDNGDELTLTLLDVGQGEAMILEFPSGETWVIDGGGFPYSDFDTGKNVMAPCLLRKKIHSLDAVIMTHGDADHYKGLRYLLERFSVKEFWYGEADLKHGDLADLQKLLQRRGVTARSLHRGEVRRLGASLVQVLWPPEAGRHASDNDRSLVLKVCHGEVCLLLTGDIEVAAELSLAQDGDGISASVLKVAHHGSATSSSASFLDQVSPRLALISAGRNNRFGFPHAAVLERFKSRGMKVLRTDRDGLIQVKTDGRSIEYETYGGERDGLNSGLFPSR